MLLAIILKFNVVVIINIIFTIFFDCDYILRKFKTSYKRTFSIFITLRHRFLKERNNVTSVFYFFNKTNISLTSYFFNITRLNLTWFSVS